MTAHVVVDARLAGATGIGTYLRNTLPRIAARHTEWRFTLIGPGELEGQDWVRFPGARLLRCDAPIYSVREQVELPLLVPRDATLYWAPHFNIPIWLRAPLVATVHDLAHLRVDQNTRNPLRRLYSEAEFRAVRRRATSVMCDSEFTLGEFRELVGEPRRAVVVPCGVDAAWYDAPSSPPPMTTPYFVFVGNFKPHKNARVLLEAMAANAKHLDARLVMVVRLAGLRTQDTSIRPLVETLGDRVKLVSNVDDATLRRYVQHATALVMPSLYEGFGLPPLEAMAAGTPALVANAASLPEVCGDAAIYFDPASVDQLAAAMRRIASDQALRAQVRERGLRQARRFSWDTTAELAGRELAHALQRADAA